MRRHGIIISNKCEADGRPRRTRIGQLKLRRKRRTMIKEVNNGSKDSAIMCASLADAKKADDIVILDIRKQLYLTDYFVICTGMNAKHVETIVQELKSRMKQQGHSVGGGQALASKTWAVVDFGDVVVHVMQKPLREYYQLEELWADAKKVNWKSAMLKRSQN